MAHGFAKAVPTSDGQLIALVRAGNAGAYEGLYTRHMSAAISFARMNVDNPSDADDVVAEAFQAVLKSLKDGKGPDQFFRAYLLSTVTRLAHATNIKARRNVPADVDKMIDQEVIHEDPIIQAFESLTIARAYRALRERWQSALWYLDVEGMKPAAVAPIMGLSPNAVSTLGARAREGLRRQYLQFHVMETDRRKCSEVASQLGAYLRGGLASPTKSKIRSHLDGCARCKAVFLELKDIGGTMRTIIPPLILGMPLVIWSGRASEFGAGGLWHFHGKSRQRRYKPDNSTDNGDEQ
ncbi:sigma-70 family RNA polymerase sigma factor [Arthrobacter sp. MI7-26]|uniref:sigma-70 family RNA polymerase sigma factor n=1 Tax=Arthrobacter sp. MI7-26 TaxID=2993653 RepID=UPI0022495A47|nr:sigma-70 family RNA polymerase sigma factor [Arthrobacter sp. MI7-26]MCX2747878.1 sigma-70 family RNA polymerase sigma factor [Arthrobacter sp. MI7-26]